MKKRILSLLLAVLTVFSLCSAAFASDGGDGDRLVSTGTFVAGGSGRSQAVFNALAPAPADRPAPAATSGICGTKLTWSFDSSTGTLTINGSGAMFDYSSTSDPGWRSLNVKTVIIGSNVTSIGAWAFAGLGYLQDVKYYENASLRSIGSCAFYNISSNLTGYWEVWYVPGTVTSLAEGALAGIKTRAYDVKSGSAASYFTASDGVLYNKAKTKLLQYPANKTSTYYSMPSTVTAVGDYGMLGAFDVTSISLSAGLRTIGIDGFYGCLSLTSITIPSSVTTIRQGAFAMCQSLSRITVQSDTCLIYDPTDTSDPDYRCALGVPGKTVVYARTGSTAHTYATKNGYSFLSTGTSSGGGTTIDPSKKNGLKTEGGYTYFYLNGVKQKGLITASDGKMYYCDASYHLVKNKVVKVNGKYYACLSTGEVGKDGWITVNGVNKYFAGADGALYTGLKTIGKDKYYFSAKDCHLMKGLVSTDSKGTKRYFSAKDGHMLTGLVSTDSKGTKRYFSAKDGHMMTGLVTTDDKGTKRYFSAKDGHMLTGLVTTDSKGTQRYFSAKDGHMLKNGWTRGARVSSSLWNYHYLDKSGVVIMTVKSRTQPSYKPV